LLRVNIVVTLCDTSSIFMLWPIAPEMLKEGKYGCVTIQEVHDEIFRTQKFKDKYPWRTQYKSKIEIIPRQKANNDNVAGYRNTVDSLCDSFCKDHQTGRIFDLSYVDKSIIACALANGYSISSGDGVLVNFVKQEFNDEFKGYVSALGIVNIWIQGKIIKWNKVSQDCLEKWNEQDEPRQPKGTRRKFRKLTRLKYPGP